MSRREAHDFVRDVYAIVRLVPFGRVTTYGAIANSIGAIGASRRVGWALNQSFGEVPAVPAHRVVNRLGMLSGAAHFPSEFPMDEQLRQEGIFIKDNRVEDFDRLFWNPLVDCELEIAMDEYLENHIDN